MAVYNIGPQGVTTITPPARSIHTKVGKIEVADAAAAFQAFAIPAGAVISGVYILSRGANATQTINAGFTSGGTDLVNAYAPNSTGYATPGAQTGTGVFAAPLAADSVVWLKASATLTNPVYVKVEYYLAPSNQTNSF